MATLAPAAARAQIVSAHHDGTWLTRVWMGDVAFLSANALLAGLTAGIFQEFRGGSFSRGFARGALGGALSYGGRRLAVEDFWGAGLLGRQVSAVGASVARNASEGRPVFSRFFVPLGPVSVHVERGTNASVRAKLDVYGAAWLAAAVLDERLEFDGSASLSAGAPVFRTPRHALGTGDDPSNGSEVGGLIVLGHAADNLSGHDVFAHERVHVLQHDFAQVIWGDPLETWVGSKIPGGRVVLRFVRPGAAYPWIQSGLVSLFRLPWKSRPWEIEAEYLEHR